MVELEEVEEMAYAITLGEKTPPAKWDQEHRDQWKRLFVQIQEIKARTARSIFPWRTHRRLTRLAPLPARGRMGVSKKTSSLLDLDARRPRGVQPVVEPRIELRPGRHARP